MATARILFALVAAACLSQLHAQSIYKCVGKDGKTSYSNSPCPDAKQSRVGSSTSGGGKSSEADVDTSLIPQLPHGKWAWKGLEGEFCGDPLEKQRRMVMAVYAAAPALGCKRDLRSPVPGNMVFILDCPADASAEGITVKKGREEVTVFSPAPDTVRISVRTPAGHTEVNEAKRLGDC